MSDLGRRLWDDEQYQPAYRVRVTPPRFGDNFDTFYLTADDAVREIDRDVEWQISCLVEDGVDRAAIRVCADDGARTVLVTSTTHGDDVPTAITYRVEAFEYLDGSELRNAASRGVTALVSAMTPSSGF